MGFNQKLAVSHTVDILLIAEVQYDVYDNFALVPFLYDVLNVICNSQCLPFFRFSV